jgi:hypothetical protein
MPETKNINVRMNYENMATFLGQLPSYVEVTLLAYNLPEQHLMARDIPREGRRFTNLTSGTEWFITAESLANLGVTAIRVHPFTVTD